MSSSSFVSLLVSLFLLFFVVLNNGQSIRMVHRKVCIAMVKYLGRAADSYPCYEKCKKYDESCTFFAYTDHPIAKDKCYWVGNCKKRASNAYWHSFTVGPPYVNVKILYQRAICRGTYKKLGNNSQANGYSFIQCKNLCVKQPGCKYFVYAKYEAVAGKPTKKPVCISANAKKCERLNLNGPYNVAVYEVWTSTKNYQPSDFDEDEVEVEIDNSYDDYDYDEEDINELFKDIDGDINDNNNYYGNIFVFGSLILIILLLIYYLLKKTKMINKVMDKTGVVMDENIPMLTK